MFGMFGFCFFKGALCGWWGMFWVWLVFGLWGFDWSWASIRISFPGLDRERLHPMELSIGGFGLIFRFRFLTWMNFNGKYGISCCRGPG